MHVPTSQQLSLWWTRHDIYILTTCDAHMMRYTLCNLIPTFPVMHTWWYIHSTTFYQISFWCTRHIIYIAQLYKNFPCDAHVMVYTLWYIHSPTLLELSLWCTRKEIYIPHLDNNFSCDTHVMISTFRNFITTFSVTQTWWYIHSATSLEL